MPDYTRAVYDHLRTLGEVGGPEFKTDIHPWLMHKYDLSADEAHAARERVMQELKERGMVERVNTRGNLRILGVVSRPVEGPRRQVRGQRPHASQGDD